MVCQLLLLLCRTDGGRSFGITTLRHHPAWDAFQKAKRMQAKQPFRDHRRNFVYDSARSSFPPASPPEDQLESESEQLCSSARSSWSDTSYARDYTDVSYTRTQRQLTSSAASPSLVTRFVLEQQLVFQRGQHLCKLLQSCLRYMSKE